MSIQVEVVTPERLIYSGEVDMVSLPGTDGQMGIMGGHAPLLSTLHIGELVLHEGSEETSIAISGGVVEVRPDKVSVLADIGENAEEIDIERAEVALARAQQSLAENPPAEHRAPLLESVRRSNLRLRVARKRRQRRSGPTFDNAS
ncbi:MAG: F0F1 ATP synthase subunit epsilon [Chloroflexota bacterium]